MSNSIKKTIDILDKNLNAILKINLNNLSFQSESALVRMFEVIGGIAKELDRFGLQTIQKDLVWKAAIKIRDKLIHSYYSLSLEPLKNAIKDIPYLISTIILIKKELSDSFSIIF